MAATARDAASTGIVDVFVSYEIISIEHSTHRGRMAQSLSTVTLEETSRRHSAFGCDTVTSRVHNLYRPSTFGKEHMGQQYSALGRLAISSSHC